MRIHCSYTKLVPLKELRPHPRNPNHHPDDQIELLSKIIKTTGWRSPIVVSRLSGLIIKGHGRYEAARLAGFKEVPIDEQHYENENEELADMVADNRIAELADLSIPEVRDILESLTEAKADVELAGYTLEDVEDLQDFNDRDGEELPPEAVGGEMSPMWLKNDVFFPSKNPLGIPDLLPDLIAEIPEGIETHIRHETRDIPRLVTYKSDGIGNCDRTKSILCFYVLDEKFVHILDEPAEHVERMLAEKWHAVVAPNVSMLPAHPRAHRIWIAYRVRWFTRYLQSVGIKVIPDIEWVTTADFEFAALGIPKGCKTVAMQMQTSLKTVQEIKSSEDGVRWVAENIQPQSVLVYGANDEWKKRTRDIFGDKVRCVFCESFNAKSRKWLKAQN